MLEQDAADLVVGVDLGGTNTAVASSMIGKGMLHSNFPRVPGKMRRSSWRGLSGVDTRASRETGVRGDDQRDRFRIPGGQRPPGDDREPANLGWGTVNIMEMVRAHFTIPVAVTNDANAALIGEQMFGVARGMKNVIMITLGTGLGAGIAVDGRLLQGENGSAGEFGHMTLDPGDACAGAGGGDAWRRMCPRPGLRRTVYELLADRLEESPLGRSALTNSPRRPFRASPGTVTRSHSKP